MARRLPILRFPALAATLALAAGSAVVGATAASAQSRCEGTLCDLYYDHMATPQAPQPPTPQPPTPQPPTPQPQSQPPRTAAQPAPASDGLLSHLFSSNPPPQAGAAPPAKKPLVAVQGGGIVGMMQGRAPERCSGTFCDFYYGGPPKEEPAAAEPVTAASPQAARAADAEIDEPAAASRGFEPRESVSRCAANPRDPWACYRR